MSGPDWPPARVQAALARRVEMRTLAVTGTNGKTTTTSMIAAIVAAASETPALLTTLGSWVGTTLIPRPAEGTPRRAPPGLHQLEVIERADAAGVRTVAVEMTSLALGRGLARRWRPHVAVFTNLTRDHLDVHPSPEAYLAAKAQLFVHLAPSGAAVLNADDPASALLREVLPASSRVFSYAVTQDHDDADLVAHQIQCGFGSTSVELVDSPLARALGGRLTLRTTGRVHAANALAAALAGLAAGFPPEAVVAGLAAFRPVAGRFELVSPPDDPDLPRVVVDYAHTPDGLAKTLATARELVPAGARVLCVFGCGGGRDRGKRPEMGAIADATADGVWLTSDNPRSEAPEDIATAVLSGVPTPHAAWVVEHDRARAIAAAVDAGGPGDVVVIAGKGHETTQLVGAVARPFSDRDVACAALASRRPCR